MELFYVPSLLMLMLADRSQTIKKKAVQCRPRLSCRFIMWTNRDEDGGEAPALVNILHTADAEKNGQD